MTLVQITIVDASLSLTRFIPLYHMHITSVALICDLVLTVFEWSWALEQARNPAWLRKCLDPYKKVT